MRTIKAVYHNGHLTFPAGEVPREGWKLSWFS